MAVEIATSIATTIFDHSLGAIVRQFGYLWNHKRNLADLKAQVKKFDDVREDNNHSVLVAKKNADRIKSRVESWQNNAEEIGAEARKIVEEYEEKEKGECLIGLCPNVVSRYRLSKKACKKQTEIVEAMREADQFRGVSERAVRRAMSIPSAVGYFAFDSRLSTLENIENTLQDVTKNLVGVYGFGGMGKTTLVKQVVSRVAEKGTFDEIVMALVTQKPDFKEIQGQIAKSLDLKLEESSVAERAGRIYGRLKGKKVLIILDDLWEVLDLEKVGIPFGSDHMGCKILLTSRYQEILSSMDAKCIFHLGALEEQEAWSLFEEKTRDVIKNPDFLNIGKDVAKRCAGLPVLIVTVGASLSSRPNLRAWKDALNQLKKMRNKEMHEFVNSAMEFISYKHLEESHKRLFLLCGLLGSGVSIANLLKYSLGWGLFDEVGRVESARNKLHTLILELKASCLLLDGDDEDIIKIHDVVRGVAISIARKDLNMFLVGDNDTELNRWPQDDVLERGTALVFHDSGSLPCLPERLACPSLEFLQISSNLTVPDPFFESMRILKVLDMSGMSFETLPPSISILGNLQTLRLDGCSRLKDISMVQELKKLQVLSLADSCNIKELPGGIGQLSELRLLDLSRCSNIKTIPAGLLKGLFQLEELYMRASFSGWEAKRHLRGRATSNVSLAELKHLSNLCSVEIEVPNTQLVSKDLDFENWERFTIIVGDMPGWGIEEEIKKKRNSRIICLHLDTTSANHLQHNVKRILKRAELLCLRELKGIKSVVHELDRDGFPELKHLIILTDYESQCIVNVETEQHRVVPALESLHLRNLLKLERICKGRLMEGSFCKLTTVTVLCCNSLESLFSFSMAKGLPCLEEIYVNSCDVLKGIVANKCEEDDGNVIDVVDEKLEFFGLRKLSLKGLPQLINFYSGVKRQKLLKTDVQCGEIFPEKEEPNSFMPFFKEVSFPRMEELTFFKISNLECIWSQYRLEILSLRNLQILRVEKCDNLKYLFTPAIVTCLVGLRELWITNCKKMKEIVVKEEGETTTTNDILFPQLSKLCLYDLPNLTTFYSEVEQIGSNENIDTLIQPLFNEKANFPSLKILYIHTLNNIKSIWHNRLSEEDSFCKLEDVDVRYCAKLLKIFPCTMLNKIHSMKQVWILHCEALEEVFEEQKGFNLKEITYDGTTVLHQMRDLYLNNLPKLRFVWKKDFHKILSFENLCKVDVCNCESLKCVFPAYVAQRLHQLKELHIVDCEGLKTIVDDDDDDDDKEVIEVSPTFLLPKLTKVRLSKLPKVECFYPKKHTAEWPLLKVLDVRDCNKIYVVDMLNLSGHEGHNQFQKVSFSRLEELKLSECDSLKYLFTPSIITSMERLQKLEIESCVMMREIVAKGERETTMDTTTFPRLSHLRLKDLPNLTTFYSGVEEMYPHENIHTAIQPFFSGKANFPNLKNLEDTNLGKIKSMWHNQSNEEDSFCKLEDVFIRNCAKLLKIFPSALLNKFQSVEKVWIDYCDALEEVFEAQKELNLKDITTVFQLRSLSLVNLPKLRFVWGKDFQRSYSFENLCAVFVSTCESLKCVFPAHVAQCMHQLEKLHVRDCKGVETIVDVVDIDDEEQEVSTTFIFPRLARLYLSELPKLEYFYPKKYTLECPILEELNVDDCDKISALDLLNFSENQQHNQVEMLLSRLQSLTIKSNDMKTMRRQYGHFPSELFLNLGVLKIVEFDHDKSADFSFKFLHGLNNLYKLEVINCSFHEIFPCNIEGPSISLPHLTTLNLNNLPELKYICKQDSPLITICFKFLTNLELSDCGGLTNLIWSSAAAGLGQLQYLTINRCSGIEEIVAADGDHCSEEDEIVFSKLKFLRLVELPRLTSFCTANCTLKFPVLISITVSECPNMRTFSPGITIAIELRTVSFANAEFWNGDLNLNTALQQHFSEMETKRLATTDPSSSSNNHFEPEAKQSESLGNEIEEICEESTKPGEEGENIIEPREEIGVLEQCNDSIIGEKVDIWCDATKPGKGKEKIEIFEEETVDSAGNEAEIWSHPYSQIHASSSTKQQGEKSNETTAALSNPANEPGGETSARSLAPQDVVVASSSQLSPASYCLETSQAASNSQQNISQILRATREFSALLSEFLRILEAQPSNNMSAEHGQLMVDAFHDLSNANFSVEWFSPYVEEVRERLEQEKEISEIEFKITETEAQLQALKERKKALQEKRRHLLHLV